VLAMAGEDQVPTGFYAYSPYGETAASGETDGNASQYTGRENDGTGLYYYRARYYDPVLKRFIAEDPIGLAGGGNVFGYVADTPTNLVDPFGNNPALLPLVALGLEAWSLTNDISPEDSYGGVYRLVDPETGEVLRTGRTNDLERRQSEHFRDPTLKDYDFEPVFKTNSHEEQRGLEQLLHDHYDPPLNKINPVSPTNTKIDKYLDAAKKYLEKFNKCR
jgi:RHS repeat-associated protein